MVGSNKLEDECIHSLIGRLKCSTGIWRWVLNESITPSSIEAVTHSVLHTVPKIKDMADDSIALVLPRLTITSLRGASQIGSAITPIAIVEGHFYMHNKRRINTLQKIIGHNPNKR